MQTASNGPTAAQRNPVQSELSSSYALFRRLRLTSLIAITTATVSAVHATPPSIASFSNTSFITFPSQTFFALLASFLFIVFALQLLALVVFFVWIRPLIWGGQGQITIPCTTAAAASLSVAPHGNHGDNKSRSATK